MSAEKCKKVGIFVGRVEAIKPDYTSIMLDFVPQSNPNWAIFLMLVNQI